MLSIHVIRARSVQQVARYYLAASDRAADDGGHWQGQGAERLGLTGPVTAATFQALLQGQMPGDEKPSRVCTRHDHRCQLGIDLTLSAPKSVSLQALIGGDPILVQLHDQAVTATLRHAERYAHARYQHHGHKATEMTDNLVMASFRQSTSRTQDPHLHTHNVVINLTQRLDGHWRALQNQPLLQATRNLGAYYHSELARLLQQHGYALRDKDGRFELASVSDAHIDAFSQRHHQMQQILAAQGLNFTTATAAQIEHARVFTRTRKSSLTVSQRQPIWQQQAAAAGLTLEPGSDVQAQPGTDERAIDRNARQPSPSDDPHDGQPLSDQDYEGKSAVKVEITADLGIDREDTRTDTDAHQAQSAEYRFDTDSRPPADQSLDSEVDLTAVSTETPPSAVEPKQTAADPTCLSVDQALHQALWHLTERQAVIRHGQLLRSIADHGTFVPGQVLAAINRQCQQGRLIKAEPLYSPVHTIGSHNQHSYADWQARLQRQGLTEPVAQARLDQAIARGALVKGPTRYTTRQHRDQEQAILDFEQQGRDVMTPLADTTVVQTWLAGTDLNDGQRRAAALMVTSRHQIVGIQGYAGVGKSHMLQTVCQYVQEQGTAVQLIAPYGSHVKALQQLGARACTVSRWLAKQDHNLTPGSLLVVDEAGVIPTTTLHQLLTVARQAQARVVLLGDTAQMTAIEAGRPFAQLQQAGMATAVMDIIKRQHNAELKHAVQLAAHGRVTASLDYLPVIEEIKDDATRYQTMAQTYAGLDAKQRDQTLIITGTNQARRALNQQVRSQLGLQGQGQAVEVLVRRDLTRAQASLASSYQVGDIVVVERTGTALARGQPYQVVEGADQGQLSLQRLADDRPQQPYVPVTVDPATLRAPSVYQRQSLELAPGDLIRLNRSDPRCGIVNGDRAEVMAIDNRGVTLRRCDHSLAATAATSTCNIFTLSTQRPLFIDHGYASTASGIQGLAGDQVLIDYDAHSLTAHARAHYVAISRARHQALIYTNDRAALPAALTRPADKDAALDLIPRSSKAQHRSSTRKTRGAAPPSSSPETVHAKTEPAAWEYDNQVNHRSDQPPLSTARSSQEPPDHQHPEDEWTAKPVAGRSTVKSKSSVKATPGQVQPYQPGPEKLPMARHATHRHKVAPTSQQGVKTVVIKATNKAMGKTTGKVSSSRPIAKTGQVTKTLNNRSQTSATISAHSWADQRATIAKSKSRSHKTAPQASTTRGKTDSAATRIPASVKVPPTPRREVTSRPRVNPANFGLESRRKPIQKSSSFPGLAWWRARRIARRLRPTGVPPLQPRPPSKSPPRPRLHTQSAPDVTSSRQSPSKTSVFQAHRRSRDRSDRR